MENDDELKIENELSKIIIGIAIDVHRTLGPGMFEKTYQDFLYHKLILEGLHVEKEKQVDLEIEGIKLEGAYRIDLLVENKVVLEIKSVNEITDIHFAQTLTYLKAGNYQLGLILNFGALTMRKGIRRCINSNDWRKLYANTITPIENC